MGVDDIMRAEASVQDANTRRPHSFQFDGAAANADDGCRVSESDGLGDTDDCVKAVGVKECAVLYEVNKSSRSVAGRRDIMVRIQRFV